MTTSISNPAATTVTTATDPGAWLREVLALMDLLSGGALARLKLLAASPPKDAAEVFPTLSAIFKKLNLHSDIIDPLATARQRGEAAVSNQFERARGIFEHLVSNLIRRADELIDAGVNDTEDPWCRLKDFGDPERGAVKWIAEGPNAGWLAGPVDLLPTNHPARSIEPSPTPYGPRFLILGRDGQTRWRLSEIKARTAEALVRERAKRESERQIAEAERLRKQREWENSDAGRAERIRELEAEVARLNREKRGAAA